MVFVIVAVIVLAGMLAIFLLDVLTNALNHEIFETIGQIIFIALVSFMITMLICLCIIFIYTVLQTI